MKIKHLIFIIWTTLILSACMATEKKVVAPQPILNPKTVKYILPKNIHTNLLFTNYTTRKGEAKYDTIYYKQSNTSLDVERKTHSGNVNMFVPSTTMIPYMGSAIVYNVSKTITETDDAMIVEFTPNTVLKVSEALVIGFAIPQLNIYDYLTRTQIKTSFEIDSEFPSTSVKANFDRLLPKVRYVNRYIKTNRQSIDSNLKQQDLYEMVVSDQAKVFINIQTFPYRNGSKVITEAFVEVNSEGNSEINLVEIMKNVQTKVQNIIAA